MYFSSLITFTYYCVIWVQFSSKKNLSLCSLATLKYRMVLSLVFSHELFNKICPHWKKSFIYFGTNDKISAILFPCEWDKIIFLSPIMLELFFVTPDQHHRGWPSRCIGKTKFSKIYFSFIYKGIRSDT